MTSLMRGPPAATKREGEVPTGGPGAYGKARCLREGEVPTGGRGAYGRARLLPSPIGIITEFEVRLSGSREASHSHLFPLQTCFPMSELWEKECCSPCGCACVNQLRAVLARPA